ncbi:MAG TPA: ATP-binding protein, partial [Candidatus Sumerlaeota bacterium]|nr:ATP-binding protein [Candidatus Sumerlaeota bacterium]
QKVLVDLNRAIESTATVSRSEWKYVAELTTDLDPALPPVACYPGELNQALLNLIINAAQAIGERKRDTTCGKGSIHITTRYLKDADQVEIRIRDDGGGIPEEIRDRIFDPFFTTKPIGKGSGQGLPIVYSVIHDKHGGQVDFVSCVGEGSVFKLRLPVAKMEDPAEVVAERAPLPDAATFPA